MHGKNKAIMIVKVISNSYPTRWSSLILHPKNHIADSLEELLNHLFTLIRQQK